LWRAHAARARSHRFRSIQVRFKTLERILPIMTSPQRLQEPVMNRRFSASSSNVARAVTAAASVIVTVTLFLAVAFGLTGEDPAAVQLARASIAAEAA